MEGKMTFQAELQRPPGVGTWTFLTVPFSVEGTYGTRARLAVRGTVNGAPFSGSLMPQGDGTHILVVNKALRDAARAAPGDTVRVVLAPDIGQRVVDVPEDLLEALAAVGVRERFDAMSYSHKKEYVDWINEAKRPDTRTRRVQQAAGMVLESKRLKH